MIVKGKETTKRINKVEIYLILLVLVFSGLFLLNQKGKQIINKQQEATKDSNQLFQKDKQRTSDNNSIIQPTEPQNISPENKNKVNDFGAVGSLNHQYLQANPYSRIVIEIDYEETVQPDQSAINTFISTLKQYSDKPGGVSQTGNNSFISLKETYSTSDLLNLAQKHRVNYSGGDTVTLYILFINGSFAQNNNALGVALNSSMLVVFKDKINQTATALVFASEIERAVLNHELGHLLGLININYKSSIDHEDANNPYHSNNEESVMFWVVEDISVVNLFRGGPPYQFDLADKHDLEKIKKGEY